ncbi:MAG: aldehyde dehydrogenase family protein [Candidatus Kariarchaeaceae archaeon]
MATISKIEGQKNQDLSSFSDHVDEVISKQRSFFKSGKTKSFEFRKSQLEKLKNLIEENEEKIKQAIQADLQRSDFAVAFTTGGVITEIKFALERVIQWKPPFVTRRLKHWMRPKKSRSSLVYLGSKSYVQSVPKGVVLIVSPWNYPFLLAISPLVGAIAAGNCTIIKPSEVSPHTSKVIAELINNNFDSEFIHVLEGGVEKSKLLVSNPNFKHIFFIGGNAIGKEVNKAAAENLIPVTLELGGKSPTIIDKDVHLEISAKRIVQMKFLNAGQTCVAPDYLFVHKDVKADLIEAMSANLKKSFGKNAAESKDYARIINDRHYQRLVDLTNNGSGTILTGGGNNAEDKYIEPTIIDNVEYDSPIMQEEIFGPILPILTWEDPDEVIDYIESRPRPLSLYIYTTNKRMKEKFLQNLTFGGAMVNDSVLYYLHPEMPLGGIGDSGIGNYSGKYTFDTFSQARPVIEAGGVIDRTTEKLGIKFFRYPPYNSLKVRLLRLMHRTFSRFRI